MVKCFVTVIIAVNKITWLLHPRGAIFVIGLRDNTKRGKMSKAIQSQTKSTPDNSCHGLFHKIIFVLRRGLKRNHEFLDLFPYLKIFFPWRSSSFIEKWAKFRALAFAATTGFAIISFMTIFPITLEATLTEAATGTAKDSTLTMSVTNPSAEVNLTVASTDGTFASSSSNVTFSVATDNYSGYTLSIQGSDDNGLLLDKKKENSFTSISSAISEATFKDAANTIYNGKWGYKPSKVDSADNMNYLPAPTTAATTLDMTSAASTTSYTISIGARADFSMPSTTYSNTFVLTAVANLIQYNISYSSNTTDAVTGMPSVQTDITSGTEIIISDNVPERNGYSFIGWCNVATTTSLGTDICSGTTYNSGATYGIDKTAKNDVTLYAMWYLPPPDGIMQNFTLAHCAAYASSAPYTLTDVRDNNTYTVRYIISASNYKRCWMTQNLRTEAGKVITPSNSNVSQNYTIPSADLTLGDSYTEARVHNSGNAEYGYYYNYCAATAGTICSNPDEENSTNEAGAIYDICPKGWRLPSRNEAWTISGSTFSSTYVELFQPVLSGFYQGGALALAETYGAWWMSEAPEGYANLRGYFTYNGTGLRFENYYRSAGVTIRCIRSL